MQYNKGSKGLFSYIELCAVFFLIFASVWIWLDTCKVTIAYGAAKEINDENTKSETKEGIYFENDLVEAGTPLTVMNAPKGSAFHWVITGADGKEDSFTTKENSYTPKNKDMEKLITVTVDLPRKLTASIYYSSLPVIYINNRNGYYGVGDYFSAASMSMQGNDTYKDTKNLYQGDISIKLRGNSTRLRQKRPFNIKLDKKTDLLGMGKNKHWALLANDIDHTLMRNKLLYDFSGAIGMDTYIKSENVVLIFNNEYQGVYQLCELVDIGSDRVDIYDWEESAEDAAKAIVKELRKEDKLPKNMKKVTENQLEDAMTKDLSWISSPYTFQYDADGDGKKETYKVTDYINLPGTTGGVLMEMDFFNFEGSNPSPMISAYSQPLYFKSPEYAISNSTLYNYMNHYIQSFEYALHSTDFIYHENSTKYNAINRSGGSRNLGYKKSNFTAVEYDGKHYSELFDMNSLVQNFIVNEYAMNWDGMKNSVFMYKDTDGLFYLGPEWDFDWAWGNTNMFQKNTWYPKNWHTTFDTFAKEQYYQRVQWNRCLIRDPYFLVRAYEEYKRIRKTVIEDMIKDGGTIDTYAMQLKIPAAANDAKWSYTYPGYKSVGFEASVRNMKKFLQLRIDWMDKQFQSLETMMNSLGYYKPDASLKVVDIRSVKGKENTVITAKITDSNIAAVSFQINGTNRYTVKVKSNKAVCKVPASAFVKDKDTWNVVQILALDTSGKYIIGQQDKGNYDSAKSNYAVFYSGAIQSDISGYYILFIVIALLIAGIILIVVIISRRKRKTS